MNTFIIPFILRASVYKNSFSTCFSAKIPANIRLDEDVLKTSWRRLSSSSSEDVFTTSSRRLGQDEYVRLSLTSSEDVFKTSSRRLGQGQYICLGHMSLRCLQDVFNTFSRRPQDIFKTFWRRLQDIFKTSSRRPAKISSRHFQGVPSS